MDERKIARINELYRKSKAEGLTESEKKEQKLLRQEYLESIRGNLRSQLNNIDIKEGCLNYVKWTSRGPDYVVECRKYKITRSLSQSKCVV